MLFTCKINLDFPSLRDPGRLLQLCIRESHCLVEWFKIEHIVKMADLLRAVRSGDIELVKKQCARPVGMAARACYGIFFLWFLLIE